VAISTHPATRPPTRLPQRASSPRPSIDDHTRLLPLHGYPAATVAPLPGSDPSTVRRGVLRLNAEGIAGLEPAPSP